MKTEKLFKKFINKSVKNGHFDEVEFGNLFHTLTYNELIVVISRIKILVEFSNLAQIS